MGPRKEQLLGEAEGVVLEIGAGTGINLPYLAHADQWIGIDRNLEMAKTAASKFEPTGGSDDSCATSIPGRIRDRYHYVHADATALPIADSSIDVVICTLVLCSVPRPTEVLGEVVRVLKPGGRFLFVEHVRAPTRATQLVQNLILPLWRVCADGCRTNQDTAQMIDSVGFSRVIREDFQVPFPIAPSFLRFHIAGTAIR